MARSLVRQRTYVIGVVISDFSNPFFAEVAGGIEEAALAADYRALFNSGDRDPAREAQALETLLQLRTDGVVLTGPAIEEQVVRKVARETPVVVATRDSRSRSFDSVVADDVAGARLAVEHLISLGHRRISHLSGGDGAGAANRRSGYETVMDEHGLRPVVVEGDYTEQTALLVAGAILDGRAMPTAVFAPNDFAAIGLLQALDDRSLRVPEDVSVVGYDDTWLAGLARIGLTTIHQDPRGIGATAVSLLLERLDGDRTSARHVVLKPELTIRSTTGPAPKRRR
ncbi:MAG: substrate-binding domain-containing protein [Acidimicrobiia bacterium]